MVSGGGTSITASESSSPVSEPELPPTADLVLYASRLVHALRRSAAISPPHLRILALLDEQGPVGVSRLAHLDRCTQPSMSTTIAGLAERGWLTKKADPNDARAGLVELTDAGRVQLREARRHRAEILAVALAAIDDEDRPTPEQIEIAVSVLRKVGAALPVAGRSGFA